MVGRVQFCVQPAIGGKGSILPTYLKGRAFAVKVYASELEDLLDRAMPGLERGLRMHQLTDRFVEGLSPYVSYELDLHPQDTFN